ncbi:hypothetical protein [Paraburkholderia oxyphila]|uniref:hypothetical protein n=1 Tax=Paraburkholderia oxyphila TaxID=614212 RepID=UPI0012EDEC8E|nr:hypothetical protein [Paraburkholderia oxyphila]
MNIIELKPARKQTRATRRVSRERSESATVISFDHTTALDNASYVRVTVDAFGNLRISNNINPVHADMIVGALLVLAGRARRAKLDWRMMRDNRDYGPPDRAR